MQATPNATPNTPAGAAPSDSARAAAAATAGRIVKMPGLRRGRAQGDADGSGAAVVHFKLHGRSYTLRKRQPGRDAPWYLTGAVAGRRLQRSMDTNVAEVARERAISAVIEPALAARWNLVAASKLKRHWATVGEVVAAWHGLALGNSERHTTGAANALLNVLRRAGVADPAAAGADVLTWRTVRRFFDAVNAACAGLDQLEAARRRRSANSLFNQAKAVLQPAAVARYGDEEHGALNVPDVAEFCEAGKAERFSKGIEEDREPPAPELVARVMEGWPALANANEFAAVGLGLAFGLRAGEVAQARWGWFRVENGLWHIRADASVKNGSGRLVVCALNPFWEVFWRRVTAAGARPAEGFVIEGRETERLDLVFRRVSGWLRGLGWPLQKTNHGLRSYAGGEVAVRYGLEAAQAWLRHRSITTTQAHYTGRWIDARKLRLGSSVEWAKG